MSARSKARKRALDILYGADVRQESINDALRRETERAAVDRRRESSWGYAKDIIEGVVDHGDEIDEMIETYAQGWTISRMPVVDRAIVRIGIWEVVFNDDVPAGVAIAEAVESATVLSTEDSAGFINGLLGRIAATRG